MQHLPFDAFGIFAFAGNFLLEKSMMSRRGASDLACSNPAANSVYTVASCMAVSCANAQIEKCMFQTLLAEQKPIGQHPKLQNASQAHSKHIADTA